MATADGAEVPPRAGPILLLWMALSLVLQAALWISGASPTIVGGAVEAGAARAESRGVGEQSDEVIRKAIRLQQDSLPFWQTLTLFGDFVMMPFCIIFRAALVATLFGGLAALTGRPIEFARGLQACAVAQGFWVLGLAVRVGLAIALRRPEIETSPTLFLPPGNHPAAVWVTLRQVDAFALLGWFAMARGGWKRGQVGLISASLVCGFLWLIGAFLAMEATLIVGAGMRLSLLPEV